MNSNNCFLCHSPYKTNTLTSMINQALYDRYATAYNQRYLDEIDDIVEEEYTEDAAKFREQYFADDEEEWLNRFYRAEEWDRKIKTLGKYWSYHIDVPRFFGLPIQLAYYKYYDKRRRFQQKQLRKRLGEEIDSTSSLRDQSRQASQHTNKQDLANVLKDLSHASKKHLDESRAFNEICGKLNDLVKVKGKRIKKITMLPYYLKQSTDRDNFSIYLRNQTKKTKNRRLSRKNMISDYRQPAIPVYAFRKPHKLKNSSSQIGHKGSMESTMSKKNVCNINIQIQNAVFCGQNKDSKVQPFKPLLRKMQSVNRLRFRNFSKKESICQIYGTINTNKSNTITHQNLGKTAVVNFKKRLNSNRSQSVVRQSQERPQSVTTKGRSKSINTIKFIPPTQRKQTPDNRRYSPSKTKRQSSITLNSGAFKRRPTSSRGKIPTQNSLKKFVPMECNEDAKQKVDRLLNQKLLVNFNPSSLYQKLKRAPH